MSTKQHLQVEFLETFVDNKAKGRISKRVFKENKARPNFPKNEHFLPHDTNMLVRVSGGKRCFFSENLACFIFLARPF